MEIVVYCAKCERDTPHVEVDDDEYFERGLKCLLCLIVWEAEPKDEKDDN